MPNSDREFDDIETALGSLFRSMWQHRAWEELQRETGITLDRAGAALLKAVDNCPRPCRMQTIAHYLAIEAPSVSRTVQQLEDANLLERVIDADDRRASNLSLTDQGRRLLKKLQRARRAHIEQAVSDWSSHDRQQLAHLLQKFGDGFVRSQTSKE